MNILVIGGTGFYGRYLVEGLLARGHKVSVFNRGQSHPGLFSEVEQITGDRDISHEGLRRRQWDAAIDTNGRRPKAARDAAGILRNQVGHYSFISSISAYAALAPGGDRTNIKLLTEDAPLASLTEKDIDDTGIMTYGGRKAVCEQWIQDEWQGQALIIRPGLIIGPWDDTHRFSYWPLRIAKGGEVLAPGNGRDAVRFVDTRDLADWNVKLVEKQVTGTFNCVGPEAPMTMGEMLTACQAAVNPDCTLHWVAQSFLESEKVQPWSDMPVWAPGLVPIDNSKALAAGLKTRAVGQTALDIVAWARDQGVSFPLKSGLSLEREAELLKKWRSTT